MVPWFNNAFGDFLKPRVCKFLINRYLGQFFEEKLSADQIAVDLYNGRGSVSDVKLCCEVSYHESVPTMDQYSWWMLRQTVFAYTQVVRRFVLLLPSFYFHFFPFQTCFPFCEFVFLTNRRCNCCVSVERRHKRPTSRPTETKNGVGWLRISVVDSQRAD